MRKRLLSTLLALCMALSLIPFEPFAVQAEAMGTGDDALDIVPGYTEAEDFGLTGSGGFGGMLTAAVEEKSAALAGGYAVTDLTMEGSTAVVAYQTEEPAAIFVALYDEETKQMKASGSAPVSQAGTEAEIEISGEIPEYFIVRAFLVDSETSSPLCGEFTSYRYTRELFELEGKTLDDFAGEYGEELLFDIDGQEETNFGVYKKGTTVAEASPGTNVLTDHGNGTYTVANADASFTSLAAGDAVSYTMADGTVLLIKASDIAVTGNTVTITEDPNADLTDFFDYLKIDADSYGSDIIIEDDPAWEEGEVTPYGGEYQIVPVAALAAEEEGEKLEYSTGVQFKITEKRFGSDAANVKVTAAFAVRFTAKFRYYLTPRYQDIALTLESMVKLSGELEGELRADIPLPGIKIPLLTGIVYAEMTPDLVFQGNCRLSGSFSIESTIGFGYNSKDRFRSLNSGPTPDASVELEGEIFVGFKPKLSLEVFDDDIAAAALEGTIGLDITGELKGSLDDLLDEDTKHECKKCIKGEVEFIGKVDVELSIAGGLIDKLEFNVLELSYKVGEFYYSKDYSEFGWGECPHFLYRVTLTTVDEIGKPVPEISVTSSSFEVGEDGSLPGYSTDANGTVRFYLKNGSHTLNLWGFRARATTSATVQDGPASVRVTLHTLVRHAKEDAACTKDGAKQYYACSVCGKLFEDLSAAKEITEKDIVIEKLGHDFTGGYGYDADNHWKGCVRGDIIEEGSQAPHAFPEDSDTCSVCGYKKNSDDGDDDDDDDDVGGGSGGGGYDYETDADGRIKYPVMGGYIYLDPASGLITKCDDSVKEADIPSTIYGYTVTGIGKLAFVRKYSLKKVTIPGSAETIYSSAFFSCEGLTDVTISEGVRLIQSEAFKYCRALTDITIPASVDVMEEEVFTYSGLEKVTVLGDTTRINGFQSCDSLVSVAIHGNVSNLGGFSRCKVLSGITVHGSVCRIEDSAFGSCSALKNVAIEGGITHIGASAFSGCTSLTEIPVPEGVLTIGDHAFSMCSALTRVTVPESATSLGEDVFWGCSGLSTARLLCDVDSLNQFSSCQNLTDVTVYGSVGRIENSAFAVCPSLTRLTIYGNLGAIEERAFSGTTNYTYKKWRDFTVYGRIGSIGKYAFSSSGLTDVTFAGGVGSMGDYAFAYCANLERFHTGPADIPTSAFDYCSGIKSLIFTGDVVIGPYAFDKLENLTDITIQNGVCRVGDGAFMSCPNLTAISGAVSAEGAYAFKECTGLTDVTVGGSTVGKHAFYMCDALEAVNILDGVNTIGEYAFYGCVNLPAVELPDSVTAIEPGAFSRCSSLGRVNIPGGVTAIPKAAFQSTRLTEVVIPDGVTEIGDDAFSYCSGLTDVRIPESVRSIGAFAFASCTKLAELTLPEGVTSIGSAMIRGTSIRSITVPSTLVFAEYRSGYGGPFSNSSVEEIIFADGLAVIPENACNYTASLVRVVIPASVEEILKNAFASCTKLQEVVYLGTDAQWKYIQIDSSNSYLTKCKPQS